MKRVLVTVAAFAVMTAVVLAIPVHFRVERSRLIPAGADAIHAQLDDLRRWEVWMVTSRSERVPGTSTFEADGALWRCKMKDGAEAVVRRVSVSAERLELEFPDRPNMTQTVTLKPEGVGTRVTWVHELTLRGPAKLAQLWKSPDEVMGPVLDEYLAALEKAAVP